MKRNSFTLVELLLVILIISFILPTIFFVYTKMQQMKKEIDIKQELVQQSYEFVERMNVLMQDYVIDYEEYFNRQMVGCSNSSKWWNSFDWTTSASWYCNLFTAYGNGNSIGSSTSTQRAQHNLYYCSSLNSSINMKSYVSQSLWYACASAVSNTLRHQSYGQYSKLFFDVKRDTDGDSYLVGDSDDEDRGTWPVAIKDPTKVQELYLISQDGKNRLFFRRKLIKQENVNGISWFQTGENLFVIQILRLRGFDAGTLHNFSKTNGVENPWLYDGQIDTWACDYSQGFIGKWASVWGAYSGYKLPLNADDCWEDLYQWSISLNAWNISLSPVVDPVLAWKDEKYQINPYIKLFLLNWVYLPSYFGSGRSSYEETFQVPIETTFNTKNFYY